MTSSVTTGDAVFSIFEIALLKDTGWYQVEIKIYL